MGGRASDAVWRRWSAGDDAELRACLARGETLRMIALATGRTRAAVDCHLRHLGLKPPGTKPRPQNMQQHGTMTEAWAERPLAGTAAALTLEQAAAVCAHYRVSGSITQAAIAAGRLRYGPVLAALEAAGLIAKKIETGARR